MEINGKIIKNRPKASQRKLLADNNIDKSSLSSNSVATSPVSFAASEAVKANALKVNINSTYLYLGEVKLPYINEPAKLYQLNNGQKVVIVPKKGPTVIRTFVKVGSMNEHDNIRGLSHFIEHNLFNGSKELAPGEFVNQAAKMGGKYNASTGFLTTDYFIESPLHNADDLQTFIKMHADMIQNPSFKDDQLIKEKGPVTSEIQMMSDIPENTANNTTLKNLFQIQTKSQMDLIGGNVENIEGMPRQTVVDYYKNWYTPDNMTTVVVGEVDPNNTASLINKYFGSNVASKTDKAYCEPLKPIQNTVRHDISNPNIETVLLNMAFVGPKNDNPKEILTSEALCAALSGYKNARSNKALKPFGIESSVNVETISPNLKDPSVISLTANFKPGTEEDGLKTIYSTLHEMTYRPLDESEMTIVKNKLKENLKYSGESAMEIASFIGHSMLDHGDLRNYSSSIELIDSLTPYDIMLASQKFLNLNQTAITMLHPANKAVSNNVQSSKTLSFRGKKPYLGEVSEYRLPNNISVYANNVKNSPIVSAQISLEATNPLQMKPGIPSILEKMLSYGTTLSNEEALENLKDTNNISSGISVSSGSISANADCSKETAGLAYNIMKENLLYPNFNQENFERAKKELKLLSMSQPKVAWERALEELFPDHLMGNTSRKATENLDNVTLNDVISSYSALISNSNVKACITGDFSPVPKALMKDSIPSLLASNQFSEGALPLLNQTLSSLGQGLPTFSPVKAASQNSNFALPANKVIVQAEQRNQAEVVQMFRIDETGNVKDKAAILLLNEILGGGMQSRLFSDLRESQKLAYRVNSSYFETDNKGALQLKIFTTTENSAYPNQSQNFKKSLEGFKKHINKLITELVSTDELETAKLAIKGNLMFKSESVSGKNSLLSSNLDTPYGSKYNDELFSAIDNAKADDIQKIASFYLTKPSVVSIIASQNTLQANKNYLTTLGEVKEVK
ncbi:MAG: pitrilysin family protein [Candidatus Gastranaerophilaceae bacterium]|jgi:predicted Zn-dependent peptidase